VDLSAAMLLQILTSKAPAGSTSGEPRAAVTDAQNSQYVCVHSHPAVSGQLRVIGDPALGRTLSLTFRVGNKCAVPMMQSHGRDPLLSAAGLAAPSPR